MALLGILFQGQEQEAGLRKKRTISGDKSKKQNVVKKTISGDKGKKKDGVIRNPFLGTRARSRIA